MANEIAELDTTALESLDDEEQLVKSPVQERREWLQNAFKKKEDVNAETGPPTSPGRSLVQDRHKWISSGIGKTEVTHKINPDEIDPEVVEDRKKWLAEQARANALRSQLYGGKKESATEERNDINSENREFMDPKSEASITEDEATREEQDAMDPVKATKDPSMEGGIEQLPGFDEAPTKVEEPKLQSNEIDVNGQTESPMLPPESPKKQSVDPPAAKKELLGGLPATPADKGNRKEHDEQKAYTIETKESIDAPEMKASMILKKSEEDQTGEIQQKIDFERMESVLDKEETENTAETNYLAKETLSEMPSDERLFITKSNSADNWQSKNTAVEAHCLDSCTIL